MKSESQLCTDRIIEGTYGRSGELITYELAKEPNILSFSHVTSIKEECTSR